MKINVVKIVVNVLDFLLKPVKSVKWHNLRSKTPVSSIFGLDRGTPIDRVYIEHFLKSNEDSIRGVCCEIADNTYTKKFGNNVDQYEILHYNNENKKATIVGDLSDLDSVPHNIIDCFILTQTLNFIYDFKSAIKGLHAMLKKDGVALITVAGISQISRYDYERWGDFWRFTDLSILKAFEEVFEKGNVEVECYGNVLSSIAFLEGISAEELKHDELFFKDRNYQLLITIKAIKQ